MLDCLFCGTDEVYLFFFKQKTAYEIRNCDWSSDVCSSDLFEVQFQAALGGNWNQDNPGGGEHTFRGVEYAFADRKSVV